MKRLKRINLNQLTIAELRFLNRRITERLKWLQTGEVSEGMKQFSIREKVMLHTRGFAKVQGKLTRHNDMN